MTDNKALIIIATVFLFFVALGMILSLYIGYRNIKDLFICKHCGKINKIIKNGKHCENCNLTFKNINSRIYVNRFSPTIYVDTNNKENEYNYDEIIKTILKKQIIIISLLLMLVILNLIYNIL